MKPLHGSTRYLVHLLAFTLLGAAAYFSRAVWTQEPAAAPPERRAPLSLRAIGAVHPRIAPDGKTVVFSYQGSIWRMPIEGGTMRRLAAGANFAVEPCWSPDGRTIAFLQGRSWGGGLVKLMDAQTGQPRPPLVAEVLGSGPMAFTPDGGQLIGALRTRTQTEGLRSLDLATGRLQLLFPMRSYRQPWALSPEGKRIASITTMDRPEEQSGNNGPMVDLWQVPRAGGEPERIVRFPARIHDLCWSADGKGLMASTELGGVHNDLWRIELHDPERPVKITSGQADEDRPSVSADGHWLLYADNHEGCPALVLRDQGSGSRRFLSVTQMDFGTPTGRLRLHVQDKASAQSLVVRLSLENSAGGYYAPPGALWRVYGGYAHWYVRGSADFEVPAGSYRLHAWHGPEYRRADLAVEVKPAQTTEQTIPLERWTDPNNAGWYSGENHIHANYGYGEYYNSPAAMLDMCAGEGLNAGNFMVANSDGDGVFDREFFRGRPDPLSTPQTVLYWNEEYRSTLWGHMTLVNLQHVVEPVFTGFQATTNPYDIPTMSTIAEFTHRQGGLVNYTHPASRLEDLYRGAYSAKGIPVHVALAQIDTMDVAGSADAASTALYHRLLNCGFHLPASAGTDCFLNRIVSRLPGGERAYVKIDGPFSYAQWIAGLKAGRSFVSNGPIVEFTANGRNIGSVLNLAAPAEVKIHATASSQFPLDRVEVLYNGKVVATAAPARDALTTSLDRSVAVGRSGWLALRAVGRAVPDVQGENLFAHTSPVYVVVAGTAAGSAEDARYFLKWIDRLWDAVEERDRIPGEQRKAEVKAEIDRARKAYQQIIERNEGKGVR
jgi:hypothetical protein